MAGQPHGGQRVQHVMMRLAHRHDTERRVGAALGHVVDPIGAPPGARGGKSLVHHAALEHEPFGGPFQIDVDVEAMRRHDDARRDEVANRGHNHRSPPAPLSPR